ncbi:hypothetical protein N431DRAFT_474422 [Stipitochalara longipes BDJ]|nr:hypothetical protein N431DRAFT_474422 [Stipitochalara longipes BDJ]
MDEATQSSQDPSSQGNGSTELFNEKDSKDFNWLAGAFRGSTYRSYLLFSHLPTSAFDWGDGGYAGSSNCGGELLYLSALSDTNKSDGLVMARGNFSTSLYASLSRAQIEFGGPATFGLEVSRADHKYNPLGDEDAKKGSSFQLGSMIERGTFNYRWPITEYYLDLYNDGGSGKDQGKETHVGTCQMFSYTQGGIFYQVLRIEEGNDIDRNKDSWRRFPPQSQIVLTMGGPVWFHTFQAKDRLHDHVLKTNTDKVFDMNDYPPAPSGTEKELKTADMIRFWDKTRKIGLEANVYHYQPGKVGEERYTRLPMTQSAAAADNGPDEVQGEFRVTAYNAVVPLPRVSGHDHVHVFVAAIRLFEGEGEFNLRPDWNPLAKLPSSEDMHRHIGINPSSDNATGAMWDTIFTEQRDEWDSVLDLSEVNLVGRTLEKILQVALIPAPFHNAHLKAGARLRTTALVSNLFIRPAIDLKATFWKVRFLYTTHRYLSRLCELYEQPRGDRRGSRPSSSETQHTDGSSAGSIHHPGPDVLDMLRVAKFQLTRIQGAVDKMIRYLVWALLDPNWNTNMMPDNHIAGDSNYFYVMTTIWFAIQAFPTWEWDWKDSLFSLNNRDKGIHLLDKTRLPPENWIFGKADKEAIPFLRWYHHGSVLNLCEQGFLSQSWRNDDFDRKVSKLEKAAKLAAAAKLSSGRPYTADDEMIDRLSFVSDELELEHFKAGRISAVAKLAMNRIKQRDFTRELNPGWFPSHEQGSTSGPWEIHALCHHSRLAVFFLDAKDSEGGMLSEHTKEDIECYKQKIRGFFNGEGTLIPCWERAHTKARKGWLSSEASAVLATTILAAHGKNMEMLLVENTDPNTQKNPQKRSKKKHARQADRQHHFEEQKQVLLQTMYMGSLMKDQLDVFSKSTGELGRAPPIPWKSFSAPRRYHPESFTNSLEDTPELYEAPLIENTFIPISLQSIVTSPKEPYLKFTQDNLNAVLKDLCVSDIRADQDAEDESGLAWKVRHLEYETVDDRGKEAPGSLLKWALYDSLVDQEVQHRFLTVRWGGETGRETLPKEHLDLLIYVIHTEIAVCLSNHVLRFARFSYQKNDSWVANITLRCWRVGDKGPDPNDSLKEDKTSKLQRSRALNPPAGKEVVPQRRGSFFGRPKSTFDPPLVEKDERMTEFKDDEPIYLLRNLREVWKATQKPQLSFELEISSIVLSTNPFGDFSKCTIISELIDREEMKGIVNEARKLWQQFVHQPQTGRCLVFLLVLGKLVQKITETYNVAINKLTSILELDTSFKRTEEEWSSNRNLALEFELGLWSLEALYKLQNSLKASVDSLLDAKEKLGAQIKDGPGTRSLTLERMCQERLGEFESSLVQLTAVNARLERRIELNTRYKESFSAVLTMRDSRASLRQNNISLSQNETIQRLTYLTIAYLPIALMASIFAIPPEQRVIFPVMGISWFVGAIFLLSLATYLMAFFVHDIMRFFTYPPPQPREPLLEPERKKAHKIKTTFWEDKDDIPALPVTEPQPPPNIWRYISEFRQGLRKPTGDTAPEGEEKEQLAPPQAARQLPRPPTLAPGFTTSQAESNAYKEPDVQETDAPPEPSPSILGRVRRIHFARSRKSTNNTNGIDGVAP